MTNLKKMFLFIQTYLGDIGGSVLDYFYKVSIVTKQVLIILLVEVMPLICKKTTTNVKHNRAKCNEMRCDCISVHIPVSAYTFSSTRRICLRNMERGHFWVMGYE